MGIALNPYIVFGRMAIFMVIMLILPIHEQRRSFHLLIPSSVSFFFKRLEVFVLQVCHLLGLCYHNISYIIIAIVKVIVFLTYFSAHLSFVYKRATVLVVFCCGGCCFVVAVLFLH